MTPPWWLIYVPLVISSLSFLVSIGAFFWSVYRDIILKPKMRVRIQILEEAFGKEEPRVILSIVNHGPGRVKYNLLLMKRVSARLWDRVRRRNTKYFAIDKPTITGDLERGDRSDHVLPFAIPTVDFTHLGVQDTFGRTHWAPKRDIRDLRKTYEGLKAQGRVPRSEVEVGTWHKDRPIPASRDAFLPPPPAAEGA